MTLQRMILAGVILATPVCAWADPATPASTPIAATKTAADPNKLICKSIEQLGSRLQTQRICTTAAQWKEYEFRAGQWNERMSSTRWLFGGG